MKCVDLATHQVEVLSLYELTYVCDSNRNSIVTDKVSKINYNSIQLPSIRITVRNQASCDDALCCLYVLFFVSAAAAAAASTPSQLLAQQPGRSKKLKVFVTDGRDVALTGVCVFFTRANTSKTITSENIHRVSHFAQF